MAADIITLQEASRSSSTARMSFVDELRKRIRNPEQVKKPNHLDPGAEGKLQNPEFFSGRLWDFRKPADARLRMVTVAARPRSCGSTRVDQVQKDAYDEWFKPTLSEAGYEGIFQAHLGALGFQVRTGRTPSRSLMARVFES